MVMMIVIRVSGLRGVQSVASARQLARVHETVRGHQVLRRRQPQKIVRGRLSSRAVSGDFCREGRYPFAPFEATALMEMDHERKGFRLPRCRKDRALFILR